MSGIVSSNLERGSGTVAAAGSGITISDSDPATNSNPSGGVGTVWTNSTSGETYVCTTDTDDANVWTNAGSGTGEIAPPKWYGARGSFCGGLNAPSGATSTNVIDYVTIATTGNSADFGDLQRVKRVVAGASGNGRAVVCGGHTLGSVFYSDIDYFTFSTLGNADDFGDLSGTAYGCGANSSGILGTCNIGQLSGSSFVPTIDKFTIATPANSTDFGDLTRSHNMTANCSNGTRGTAHQGYDGGKYNTIDYITFASPANALEFGEMSETGYSEDQGTGAPTRGLVKLGDGCTQGRQDTIEYITIASTGNSDDFGDTSIDIAYGAGYCSDTRSVWGGGYVGGVSTVIEYVTTATEGNSDDFGDMEVARYSMAGTSG